MAITLNGTTGISSPGGDTSTSLATTNLSYTGTLTGGTGVIAIGTNQIYKDASGNVGIGTASPSYKFHVQGAGAAIVNPGATASLFVGQGLGANQYGYLRWDATNTTFNIRSQSNPIVFGTDATDWMRLDASGNLGIGGATSGYARINSTTATNSAGIRVTDGTYSGNITPSSLGGMALVVEGAYSQIFYVNGSERARIDSSGALTVPNIYTNTTAAVTYVAVSSAGLLQRGGVSALKYKQDIRDLESIDITKFRPVRYKSKCENDDQTIDYFGFIADEVEEAGIKELITYNDDGEPEGFQYERMTVVLLKAIQELSQEIETLKQKVN